QEVVAEIYRRTGADPLRGDNSTEPRPAVALLGLAYKPDIDDLRESPAMEIARTLIADGRIEPLLVEPHLEQSPLEQAPLLSTDQALTRAQLAVVLVAHRRFRQLDRTHYASVDFLDCVGLWG
ncbi:MAG TPA: hypothetical protein ENJ18_04780, partial [Nannocystis exedens]|nr:hypothetical protein [Nannocystis exedens]